MKEVDLSPREWQREVTLQNGLEVVIRPVRPDDEELATECLRRVSRADLRLRYFAAVRAPSKLAATANAPIFSYLDNFFGDTTTVGGPIHSVDESSSVAAAVAVRILNGEKAGNIKTPPTRYAAQSYFGVE